MKQSMIGLMACALLLAFSACGSEVGQSTEGDTPAESGAAETVTGEPYIEQAVIYEDESITVTATELGFTDILDNQPFVRLGFENKTEDTVRVGINTLTIDGHELYATLPATVIQPGEAGDTRVAALGHAEVIEDPLSIQTIAFQVEVVFIEKEEVEHYYTDEVTIQVLQG